MLIVYRREFTRGLVAFLLNAALLSTTACEGTVISRFRVGFAVSKPIIQTLIDQHVVPQNVGTAALADVDDGLNAAFSAEQRIKAIPAGLSARERQIAKARIYYDLAAGLRIILQRHNLAGQAQLDAIAAIAASVINALEEYYRQVVEAPVGGFKLSNKEDKAAEAELERALKQAEEEFKAIR